MSTPRRIAILAAAVLTAAPVAALAQSHELASYVLLAGTELRTNALTASSGDVGVSAGQLLAARPLEAPTSTLVASTLRLHSASRCGHLFGNDLIHASGPGCGPAQAFTPPLFTDLATTCGLPNPFPACGGAPITVGRGETRELAPGTYGDVAVLGGGGNSGTLILTGGSYRFCSLRSGRRAKILPRAASTVTVNGAVSLSNGSFTGPTAAGLSPCSLQLLVAGTRVRFSRQAEVRARLCAPNAYLSVTNGAALQGGFAAGRIRVGRVSAVGGSCGINGGTTTTTNPGGSTTTTSSTVRPTTTTTRPAVCGDGVRGGTEECDGDDLGGATCASIGLGEGTLRCTGECRFDRLGCTCGNGSVDASTGEICDPAASTSTCAVTEACGAAGTTDACMCIPSNPTLLEVCGNCLDDDRNGLADFEDPACCPEGRGFALTLRRGRIRDRGAQSKLRLKAILARSGLEGVNPLKQDVFLQMRPEGGSDIFCAHIPAGKWKKKRHAFKFRDRKRLVASALGLDTVKVDVKRKKGVRLRARARRAQMRAPSQGRLQLTVGFRDPAAGDEQNRCSSAVTQFRAGRKGRLVAP